ncbi:hypothetical protein K2X33_12480 [bacterium]|nr:hypothetical protein [bacterium]
MGNHPLQTGNYLLILLGIVLALSGPYIIYRTVVDVRSRLKQKQPLGFSQFFNHGLNVLIAALFEFAGILFVLNNLRGNALG